MTQPDAADPRNLRLLLGICAALFTAPIPFFLLDHEFTLPGILGAIALAHLIVLRGTKAASLRRAALAAQVLGTATLLFIVFGAILPSLL